MTTATRPDGRRYDQTRPLNTTFEGLARVDGSARFAFGTTTALASLSGPIEVRLANELPNKATFEVLVRPLANISATDAKATASTIKSALEPSLLLARHPRTLVQLVVQSLSAPLAGSSSWVSTSSLSAQGASPTAVAAQWKDVLLLPALINASSLALLNASSVPMRGVVVAVSVGRVAPSQSPASSSPQNTTLVLDPSEDEAAQLQAGGCFAFLFADGMGDCVWSGWKALSGGYDEQELFDARTLALKGAREVYARMRAQMSGEEYEEVVEKSEDGDADEEDDDKMEI